MDCWRRDGHTDWILIDNGLSLGHSGGHSAWRDLRAAEDAAEQGSYGGRVVMWCGVCRCVAVLKVWMRGGCGCI